MPKNPQFETQELVTFDTTYGGRHIQLDIPKENFDLESFTIWLTSDQICELCNTTVAFIKASRLMTNHIFDDDKCIQYTKDAQCKYSLSVSLLLMIEYAPTIANRFITFATRKLCELYLEEKTSKDIKLRELPFKIESISADFEKAQKRFEDIENRMKRFDEDLLKLKLKMPCDPDKGKQPVNETLEKRPEDKGVFTSFSTLADVLNMKGNNDESKPTEHKPENKANDYVQVVGMIPPYKNKIAETGEQHRISNSPYHDDVSDDAFFTVIDFMRMPAFNKLIRLDGIADESKLIVSIKSVLTQQANYLVRGQMSQKLNITTYEAKDLFNYIMDSWKSENPSSLAKLCPKENEAMAISKLFHYEKTYTFYRDDGLKYNCVLSYPYSTLREAVKTALRYHKFDEIFQNMQNVGILDDGISTRAVNYVNS